jgi:hypothetical protein
MTIAVASGVAVLAMRGCLSKKPAPDERLADRLEALCSIARANIDSPERGVRELGSYLDDHLGHVMGELGETIAAIERIPDDREHDDRARLARDRLSRRGDPCEADWERFANAVANDPAASKLVDRAVARFSRTIDIIFKGRHVDLAHFPDELVRALP